VPTSAPRRALAEPNPYETQPEPDEPTTAPAGTADWLRGLGWREFENLVANAYRLQGYQVTITKDGADGGIDIVLTGEDERVLVQCKHWRSYQVGAPVVREMLGLVVAHGATGGVVVTSGRFSQEAEAFAREQGIQLLDGAATMQLVTFAMVAPAESLPPPVALPDAAVPQCPVCGSPTAVRKARRGSHAGEHFWGCTRYPSCRGIISIPAAHAVAPSTPSRSAGSLPTARPASGVRRAVRSALIRIAGLIVTLAVACGAMYLAWKILLATLVPK
jgi:ssDNA-binding Zn-finger/Zn-ribbon topoisomerase 1